MNPTVHRFDATQALFDAFAERWAALARRAVERHGVFHVALSGGGSPKWVFQRLAVRDDIPWEAVQIWFGDERHVPLEHPDSNYRMAREALLDRVGLAAERVHPMVSDPADAAGDAERYDRLLAERLPAGHGEVPRFDLVMLGMGPDGHIASLFPDSAALAERHRWAVANYVEKFDAWRITLTYPVIEEAAHLLFLVAGEGKAEPVARGLGVLRGEDHLPVERIQAKGAVEWFLDAAAASRLGDPS